MTRAGNSHNSTFGRADYYSGGRLSAEEGTIIRDWGGRYPFAIVYPNSYFIGMSNLGIQTLYRLLNNYQETVGERFFWESDKNPLLSIESSRPLTDYACLAFSFSYELDYLNLASILRSGKIPLFAYQRDESFPLVIGGGPCVTVNPAPVKQFFDALCIGEAEAILPDILPFLVNEFSREKLLQKLAEVPGVYVPSLSKNRVIQRRWFSKLEDQPAYSSVMTRDTELGDLYLVEVERGCVAKCSFCMVSRAFAPLRFVSLDSLKRQATEGFAFRDRVGLVGPAVTDHPNIEEFLKWLVRKGVGFSLSSIRLNQLELSILKLMVDGGAQTVSLAPEAGTERLRKTIGKNFSEEEIMNAVGMVGSLPFKRLKLYFMIGLPTETDEDIDGIVETALRCQQLLEKKSYGCRLILNISQFIPKAGTPFQWFGMQNEGVLEHRMDCIKNSLSRKGIEIKAESPQWSRVQAFLARGGAELSNVIACMDRVSLASWKRATNSFNGNGNHYIEGNWNKDASVPWDMIKL